MAIKKRNHENDVFLYKSVDESGKDFEVFAYWDSLNIIIYTKKRNKSDTGYSFSDNSYFTSAKALLSALCNKYFIDNVSNIDKSETMLGIEEFAKKVIFIKNEFEKIRVLN